MRHVGSILIGVVAATTWSSPVRAVPPTEVPADPPPTVSEAVSLEVPPVQEPPPIVDPNVVSGPLVVIPAGCFAPPAPVAVFIGTLAAADATTARFAVQQLRAGSLDGYAVETIVDVRYDDDIRFLRVGQQYLVGAAPDRVGGILRSKVREPAQLFGGDAVIGVNDTNVRCPLVEDGVKTLLPDGAGVDTGVLAPLKTAKKSLLKAVFKPLAIAFGVLVVLAAIKLLIFAMVRAARQSEDEDTARRVDLLRGRQHTDEDADDDIILTGSGAGGGGAGT